MLGGVIRPAVAAAAVLLLGCEATPPPPPPPLHSPPPPIAPPDGDVPFKGTYVRRAKISYRQGKRVREGNDLGTASIRIETGKVMYDQSYTARNEPKYVGQAYTFGTSDVRAACEAT